MPYFTIYNRIGAEAAGTARHLLYLQPVRPSPETREFLRCTFRCSPGALEHAPIAETHHNSVSRSNCCICLRSRCLRRARQRVGCGDVTFCLSRSVFVFKVNILANKADKHGCVQIKNCLQGRIALRHRSPIGGVQQNVAQLLCGGDSRRPTALDGCSFAHSGRSRGRPIAADCSSSVVGRSPAGKDPGQGHRPACSGKRA
jgi:hypothetical protein